MKNPIVLKGLLTDDCILVLEAMFTAAEVLTIKVTVGTIFMLFGICLTSY